jgi:putative membrane protein
MAALARTKPRKLRNLPSPTAFAEQITADLLEKSMYRNLALIGMFAVALTATQASSADKQDQAFIKDAIEGNLAEVQMGKLAQDKGQSDAVKSFGQMLVNDHGNANQTATSVANQIGVTPPTEPNKTQKAMYDKLSKLTGDAFDRQFATEMVADHKKDIQKYQRGAKEKNEPVADYANQTPAKASGDGARPRGQQRRRPL